MTHFTPRDTAQARRVESPQICPTSALINTMLTLHPPALSRGRARQRSLFPPAFARELGLFLPLRAVVVDSLLARVDALHMNYLP